MLLAKLSLAALVGLLALVQCGWARRPDMNAYCAKLDTKLAKYQKNDEDSEATYKLAMWYVDSIFHTTSWEHRRLARAWEAVTYQHRCSSSSLHYMSSIAACAPDKLKTLKKTLNEDARIYSQRCITPKYLDKRLKWVLFNVLNDNPKAVHRLLSEKFIAAYRESNPNEAQLGAINDVGETCCRPERSTWAMAKLIRASFEKHGKDVRKHFDGKPNKLKRYMKKRLFRPCENYLKAIKPLIRGAASAAFYHPGQHEAFFSIQTKRFQEAVFRFEFCVQLRKEPIRNLLLDRLYKALKKVD